MAAADEHEENGGLESLDGLEHKVCLAFMFGHVQLANIRAELIHI